jgi:O-antigen/teichoic acid export membrane protein
MAKQRSNKFNTYINIITSVGVLVVNLFISFWLSPYIIRTIGVEANGFVSLANNFVTYANLIVTALNAMAARFITIAYVKQDYKKANLYYNSVFWGNLIIVAVLLIPAIYMVVKLENFIDIPMDILLDVKILFSMVFLSFFVRTGAPNYDCGTYITNRMDLSYIPNMVTAILRCILLVGMFAIWVPHVWYVTFVTTVLGFLTLGVAGHYTHKLTPELKVSLRNPICSWKANQELLSAGIWSSIAGGGAMLLSGLDLLMCNLYIGATAMGVLALSKTLPSILGQFSDAITDAFTPEMTINFAKGNKNVLLNDINRAMKISAVTVTIPAAGIVVMSDVFYSLWVPTQDAKLLQALTTLAILSYMINSGIIVLHRIFAVVNRTRLSAIAMIITGGCSLLITWLMIVFTDWDIYAVAGVSSIVTICKNVFFVTPVTAVLLGYSWKQFFPCLGTTTICSAIVIAVGIIAKQLLSPSTWLGLFVTCGVVGVIGLCINVFLVLNKGEREFLFSKVKSKLRRQSE